MDQALLLLQNPMVTLGIGAAVIVTTAVLISQCNAREEKEKWEALRAVRADAEVRRAGAKEASAESIRAPPAAKAVKKEESAKNGTKQAAPAVAKGSSGKGAAATSAPAPAPAPKAPVPQAAKAAAPAPAAPAGKQQSSSSSSSSGKASGGASGSKQGASTTSAPAPKQSASSAAALPVTSGGLRDDSDPIWMPTRMILPSKKDAPLASAPAPKAEKKAAAVVATHSYTSQAEADEWTVVSKKPRKEKTDDETSS